MASHLYILKLLANLPLVNIEELEASIDTCYSTQDLQCRECLMCCDTPA